MTEHTYVTIFLGQDNTHREYEIPVNVSWEPLWDFLDKYEVKDEEEEET
jgi:hypothetical protein